MDTTLTVGIMGAGRIAQGFDAPGDTPALSLANATQQTEGLTLGGFFDRDPARAGAAESKWDCPATSRDRAAWLALGWDVIAIATPEAEHEADVRDAIPCRPRAILVEKPVALDPIVANALLSTAISAHVPVIVDLPRRYHSSILRLANTVEDLGAPRAATFVFSGPPPRGATHMIDLVHRLWGDHAVTRVYQGSDTTVVDLHRRAHSWRGTFVSLPAEPHYVWEMRVYCERGRVELADSPEVLDISVPRPHPSYSAFDVLTSLERRSMEDEPLLQRLMSTVVRAATEPEQGAELAAQEIAAHRFAGQFLQCLSGPHE